jgi:hypothetical protein
MTDEPESYLKTIRSVSAQAHIALIETNIAKSIFKMAS